MDIKDIAKEIRAVLKGAFPATKFSVKSSRFSQGSSVDTSWTDGPTKTQVNDLIGEYGTRSQFINTDRTHTVKLANKAVDAWKVQNPEYAHITIIWIGETQCYGAELSGFNSGDDIGFCEDSINEFVRNSTFENVNFILATTSKQKEVSVPQPQLTPQPQPSNQAPELVEVLTKTASQPHKLESVKPVVNVEVGSQEMPKPEGELIYRTDINRVVDVFSRVTSVEMYCEAYDWQAQNLREIDIVQDIYAHALNTELYQIAENKYKTLQSNSSTWFVITTKNRQDVQLTSQPELEPSQPDALEVLTETAPNNQVSELETELLNVQELLKKTRKLVDTLESEACRLTIQITAANLAQLANKAEIKQIILTREEGTIAESGTTITATSWLEAERTLKQWAKTVISLTRADKCQIVFEFADGESFKLSSFELMQKHRFGVNLSQKLLAELQYMAGEIIPAHMTRQDYENYCKFCKINPDVYKRLLNSWAIPA